MKRFILFALAYSFSVFMHSLPAFAQDSDSSFPDDSTFPNYVVIGAFAHKENAISFTDEAKHNQYTARFEMNPNRNLYYVYVLTTEDREYARAEALRLRAETKYFDAWVYSGVFGKIDASTIGIAGEQHDFNPVTGQRLENVSAGEQKRSDAQANVEKGATSNQWQTTPSGIRLVSNDSGQPANNLVATAKPVTNNDRLTTVQPGAKRPQGEEEQDAGIAKDPEHQPSTADEMTTTALNKSSAEATAANTQLSDRSQNKSQVPGGVDQVDASVQSGEANTTEAVVDVPAPTRQSTQALSSEEVVGRNFYFHLYRADNQKTVPGEVDAIDFEKSRKMGTYPANEEVKVTMAGGKMKHISFVCQVFGYRKQQQEFDPESPSELLYLDDKGNLVVPFELVRLQKGDVAIMYNVFFFKDAAVMRPESRYEVNNLLDLLVENPSYKIMIHGHTNGNASGKIIRMDKPENFYSLSGTKQGFGSAKQLSEERALVIREFLISSGISADRMQVKAWGGKKPIHDKHSVRAQENVRVEIEILSQ